MSMKKLFGMGLLLATVAVMSCTGGQKKAVATEEGAAEEAVVEAAYYGTYEGVLPCADCPGIKVTLTIKEDTTYDLKEEYLEEEDGVMKESGTYRLVLNDEVIELLTPSSGDKTYYRILDGSVALTDSTGVLNEGELAEAYVLKKVN